MSARAVTPLRDALRTYGVAVVAVGFALPVTFALFPAIRPTISPVFLGAVMVAAWVGGLRGGLLATALAWLAMDYFFIEPVYSIFSFGRYGDVLRLGVFVLVALLISALNAARRRTEAVRSSRSTTRGAASTRPAAGRAASVATI